MISADPGLVAAPPGTVAAVLAETWLLSAGLEPFGVTVSARRPEQFLPGVEVPVRVRPAGPVGVRAWLRCARADENGILLRVVGAGWWVEFTAGVAAAESQGTVLRCAMRWSPAWLVGSRLAGRLLGALVAGVRARAERLVGAPVVVGTAILADGAVLAAQRERPAALAGRWEFPGGRVEPGEDEPAAVVRECREELGAEVRVLGRLGPDLILPSGWLLRIHAAELLDGQRPAALEHRSLRWVRLAELATLNWLDGDRAVLPALRALLTARSA
jgi:8-oxo-dGTP diphosphatase